MLARDQQYAAKIFEQIDRFREASEAERNKYGSMAHRLPVLIRTAGLAQALAFADSRNVPEHRTLLDHIAQVVGLADGTSLVRRSREATELTEYMRVTREVLAALLWYKRFAQSLLGVEAGEEAGGGDSE